MVFNHPLLKPHIKVIAEFKKTAQACGTPQDTVKYMDVDADQYLTKALRYEAWARGSNGTYYFNFVAPRQ